jgi:hypothetical protein
MNKIESILYFRESGIPTLDIHVIDRGSVREQVTQVFQPHATGWVARSGGRPSIQKNGKPDGAMPWHATKPLGKYPSPAEQLEELVAAVEEIYTRLASNQVAFLHHQREFQKSGVIRIDDVTAVVEAVEGWPTALSHGTVNPAVRYYFHLPSLFTHPTGFEGDGEFLSPFELSMIGSRIANRLDFAQILGKMDDTLAVEFSFGNYQWGYDISAHDIQVGRTQQQHPYAFRINRDGRRQTLPLGQGLVELADASFHALMLGLTIPSDKILAIPEELRQMGGYDLTHFEEAPSFSLGRGRMVFAAELLLAPSVRMGRIVPVESAPYWEKLREEGWDTGLPFFTSEQYNETVHAEEWFIERGLVKETRSLSGVPYVYPTKRMLFRMGVLTDAEYLAIYDQWLTPDNPRFPYRGLVWRDHSRNFSPQEFLERAQRPSLLK